MKYFFLLTLFSCSFIKPKESWSNSERMLPNGDWELAMFSELSCKDRIDGHGKGILNVMNKSLDEIVNPSQRDDKELTNKCFELYKGALATRAQSLCTSSKQTFYGCQIINGTAPERFSNHKLVLACYSKCD